MSEYRIYGLRVDVETMRDRFIAVLLGRLSTGCTEQQAVEQLKIRIDNTGDPAIADIRNQHAALTRVREALDVLKAEAADTQEHGGSGADYMPLAVANNLQLVIERLEAALEWSDS